MARPRKPARDRVCSGNAHRKNEEFLDRIGRIAGVGGWELDIITGALHWTAETYRIHGLPPDYTPTIEAAIAFYAPPARAVIRDAVERAIAGGEGWDLELPFRSADGRDLWVRAAGSVTFENGRAIRITGAFQDITEQVADRIQLQRALERASIATGAAAIGIWEWDIAADRMLWDSCVYRLYGVTSGCGIETLEHWRQRLHPDDVAAAERAVREHVAEQTLFNHEFRVIWDDGSIHHLRGRGRVSRDAQGRAVRMVGSTWDITDQRQLAAEVARRIDNLAEAVEREIAVFTNSPDVNFILQVNGEPDAPSFVFETVSPSVATIIGREPAHYIGHTVEACLPETVAAATNADVLRCLAERTTIRFARVDSTLLGDREFEGSVTPIRNPATGDINRVAGLLRDVTDRNRMQAALLHDQKMAAIGRLAAGVSHDFNNILQSISGGLELVLDDLDEGTRAHSFATVGLRAAERGANLTHQLLSYARKQMLRPRTIVLPTLLSDIETLLGRTLGSRVTVAIQTERDLSAVHADPGLLEAALLNLAVNAAYAMPDGGSLSIAARDIARFGARWVCLSVADTGTGMDAQTLAQAVEPFFTTKGVAGTGLGLSMVQGFIEQSGGRLAISSEPGAGTTVELLLPAAWPRPQSANAARPTRPAPATGCILLVDDDQGVLLTTAAVLSKAGYRVLEAHDGSRALELLDRHPEVEAVVTDFAMPGLTGAEVVAAARQVRPGLPAVIISGFVDQPAMSLTGERAERVGKPFQRDELVAALQRVMRQDSVAAD